LTHVAHGTEIPYIIRKMVEDGILEEMPFDQDCHGFSAAFHDGHRRRLWACLYVERADRGARKTWPDKYTLTVQPDPTVLFGRRIVATEDLSEVVVGLNKLLKGGTKDKQGRFKILEKPCQDPNS
jgi:hypothetical protein